MAVAAVIFDVGNVLYQWSLRDLFAKLIPDRDELDWFLAHVVTPEWHFAHDAGTPLGQMYAERSAQFPDHADLIHAYTTRFNETLEHPVPGMVELVGELAARDVPIYGITNFGSEFWDAFRPTAPVFDHFRDIVVSGKELLVKPDPAIYRLALDRFGLSGPDSIFVDDRDDNIAAAEAFGIRGHHFSDADRLRAELVALGLLD